MTLASASPQRRAILAQVGIPFAVRASDAEELAEGRAEDVALENARRKAAAVDGDLVIACDTVVDVDGDLLGKPADAAQARTFVARLNGRAHRVVSGLWVDGEEAVAVTTVRFRAVPDAVLDWYVGTGEWEGRAGGYAIQGSGAALVARVDGDYLNVVGLPLATLLDLRPDLLPIESPPNGEGGAP